MDEEQSIHDRARKNVENFLREHASDEEFPEVYSDLKIVAHAFARKRNASNVYGYPPGLYLSGETSCDEVCFVRGDKLIRNPNRETPLKYIYGPIELEGVEDDVE
jgi:hypothetical protein